MSAAAPRRNASRVRPRDARIPLELAGRTLVYFAVVADLGSMSVAARRLNLSQPALSKAIRLLERALKARLLTRSARGVAVTRAGEVLLHHAHEVIASLRSARTELERVRGVAPDRCQIGVARGVPASLFGAALGRVMAAFPTTGFALVDGTTAQLLAALSKGELDVAVLAGAVPTIPKHVAVEPIPADPGTVVARAGHPLARRADVTLERLAEARWVVPPGAHPLRALLDASFARCARMPEMLAQTSSLELAVEVVAHSDALAVLPVASVRPAVERGQLVEIACRDVDWAMPLALATRRPDGAPAAARAVAEELRRSDRAEARSGAVRRPARRP